jgi:endonuclease/exonuclease/phosphatase family metal-dependent hydrolase
MHTDPDEIDYELDVLANVFVQIKNYEYPEEDVILLGDLNAAPGRLQNLEQIPGVAAIIQGIPTNTRKNKTLDNFLIDTASTREFTGRAGTIDLADMFQLQLDDVERLSDHLPIWAEFTMDEAPSSVTAMAATGAPVRR